jgi:hypothetical protein
MYSEQVYYDGAHFAHIAAYEDHLRWTRRLKAYWNHKQATSEFCDLSASLQVQAHRRPAPRDFAG